MHKCIILPVVIAICQVGLSQSIGINSDASSPHPSAMLDIKSNNKGIVIPRVNLLSETDVTTIVNPATSVLLYNTNSSLPDGAGFHYWNGNKWTRLLTNTNALNLIGGHAWGITGNSAADTNFIGTTNNRALVFKTNNILSGKIDPGPNNVFFGQYAGAGITTGINNTFLGHLAGQFSTSGTDNVFAGHNAGNINTTGAANVFVGQDAGRNNQTGSLNVFVGEDAGIDNLTGSGNILLGNGAGRRNIHSSGNIAIGRDALAWNTNGYGNVVIGDKALANSTRIKNVVAIGDSVMYNTGSTGVFAGITAVGSKALFSNTTGDFNTAFGFEAMYENTIGTHNVAVGIDAMRSNIDGSENTAVGVSAMQHNDNGSLNTAVGTYALLLNQNGDANTAVGNYAMYNFSGDGNVGIGHYALNPLVGTPLTGDSNTAVGTYAGPTILGLENTSCVGNRAIVSSSNTMVFGNDKVNRWAFGIPTTNAQHALEVGEVFGDGNGAYLTQGGSWTNASDVNKKEDISPLNQADILKKINSLPVLRWKYKGGNEYHIGPMAQDFNRIFAVGVDDKGISTIDPAGISLAGVQVLAKELEELKKQYADLLKVVQAVLEKR
jgi:hypothetical protein